MRPRLPVSAVARLNLSQKANERSPDGAERNPGLPRGIDAAPDFAALHPGYVFELSCKNAFCESFPRLLIDFQSRSHLMSTALRSNVSRQQSRCLNDLQRKRVSNSATAFDNRPCIVLKEKIPLTK